MSAPQYVPHKLKIKPILNMIEGVTSMYRFLEKVIAITGVHG